MSLVKQILLCVVVLAIAAGGWFAYQTWIATPAVEVAQGTPGAGPGRGPGAPGGPGAGGPGAPGPGAPGPGAGGPRGGRLGGPPLVIAAKVVIDQTGNELRAIGSLAAAKAITLFPPATGLVTEVAVAAGATVKTGDVILKLDSGDQEIAVESAELALGGVRDAVERAERLARSQNITEVALAEARAEVARAEITLRSAKLALARRQLVAPFDGEVGLIKVSVGDMVTTQTEITTLDDLSTFTVSFVAPQAYSGRLKVGHAVAASAEGAPGQAIIGEVSAVDSRADPTTRTFAVEASLSEGLDGLKPGMSVAVVLAFEGEPNPAVPSLAVQWDRNGSYVWKLDGDVVKRTDVSILARRSGMVKVAGPLAEGDEVVVEGLQRLREGATIARAGAPAAGEPQAGGPSATPANNNNNAAARNG